MTTLWDLLDEEEKALLKKFLPKGWQPSKEEPPKEKQEAPRIDTSERFDGVIMHILGSDGFHRDVALVGKRG